MHTQNVSESNGSISLLDFIELITHSTFTIYIYLVFVAFEIKKMVKNQLKWYGSMRGPGKNTELSFAHFYP